MSINGGRQLEKLSKNLSPVKTEGLSLEALRVGIFPVLQEASDQGMRENLTGVGSQSQSKRECEN